MKKTKKLLALLSALSLIISTLPMALASETETEITTLVLEENGTALVNGGTEYVTDYGYTEIFVNGEEGTPDAGSDNYTHNWTGTQEYRVRYYPKLTAGAYKVYVYVPAKAYWVPLLMDVSDGTENQKMLDTSVLSNLDGQKAGPGAYVEYGTFTFTGEYGTDYIELKESIVHSQGGSYNQSWMVEYDSVKFVSTSAAPEITLPDTIGDVDELILEEDGQALVNNDAAGYVSNYGGTAVIGTATEDKTKGSNGQRYWFSANNSQSCYVKYYPVLNAGKYDVYLYTANYGAQPGLTVLGSDGTSISTAKERKTEGFLKLGTYSFTGEYGKDYVKVTENLDSMDEKTTWRQYCDAVKFVKRADVTTEPGEVESLILEENGDALVNDATEYVVNYGSTTVTGNATVKTDSKKYNGGSVYSFPGNNSQTKYVTYYPVLNEGKYKVSIWVPSNTYQSGLTISGSDGTLNRRGHVGQTAPTAGFKEIGTYSFKGVFGTDYIKVTNYGSEAYNQYCDAIKFEKVDERVGAWSFEDAAGTDSIGKYTWTVAKGESVDTVSDGFKGKGWKIVRPTVNNDIDSTQSSAVKLTLPADMAGGKNMSINLWVRNDGTGWFQNIIEILQNNTTDSTKAYRLANVRLESAKIATHMRGSLGDPENIGNSRNKDAASSIDVGRGEWHMVTLTYYANKATWSAGAFTLNVYYDGVLVGGAALDNDKGKWTNTLQEYTEIYIGADHNGKNRFNGEIDELEIYDGTLTKNQVKLLYDKEKRAASSITDNTVNMSSDTAVGTDNSIVLSAPGVTASSTDFEASATSKGIFDGELVYVSNIPKGIYVSNVTAADDAVTVTFAGTAAEAVKQTIYMRAAVQAYGDNTANSDRQIASLLSVYDMKLVSGSVTDEVYTASILNNSYVGKTVDAVVAVYNADGSMKDVYLGKEITVPTGGSTFTVTTDTLNYTEGNTVKLFVFDSIATIKPVNMCK